MACVSTVSGGNAAWFLGQCSVSTGSGVSKAGGGVLLRGHGMCQPASSLGSGFWRVLCLLAAGRGCVFACSAGSSHCSCAKLLWLLRCAAGVTFREDFVLFTATPLFVISRTCSRAGGGASRCGPWMRFLASWKEDCGALGFLSCWLLGQTCLTCLLTLFADAVCARRNSCVGAGHAILLSATHL